MAKATTKPFKPRRWLKRLTLAGVAMLALLLGLRVVWGHVVQTRLDQAVAEIQAEGEPILFEDMQGKSLDSRENGAWYLRSALSAWPTVQGYDVLDDHWYSPGSTGQHEVYHDPVTDNAAYLRQCESAMELIREADAIEDAEWNVRLSRPVYYVTIPALTEMRQLARLMADAAHRAIAVGDIDLALDVMLHLPTLADHVSSRPLSMIESLVSLSILAINRDLIETALPKIDAELLRDGPARRKAERLIEKLSDDLLRDIYIRGMVGERYAAFDLFQYLIDQPAAAQANGYTISGNDDPIDIVIRTPGLRQAYRPALKNEQHLMVQSHTTMIEAMRSGKSFYTLIEIYERTIEPVFDNSLLYPVSQMVWVPHVINTRTYHRVQATLRMAAAAVAIKLYEADHGERPDRLDQLVPDYLVALPADPFDPGGGPIRYAPAGVVPELNDADALSDAQRAQLELRPYVLLYSIDQDKADNGGLLRMNAEGDLDEDRYFSEDEEQSDIWFLLEAKPEARFDDLSFQGGF